MPMYDYKCEHCGEAFEELRPIAERESAKCPQCGKAAKKVLSSFFTSSSSSTSNGGRGGGCGAGGFGGG